MSLFASRGVWCKATRKIAESQACRRHEPPAARRDFLPRLADADSAWHPGRGSAGYCRSRFPAAAAEALPDQLGHDFGPRPFGHTLFQLTDKVDAGVVYFQEAIEPADCESFASIQERVAELSAGLFERFLDADRAGTLSPQVQQEADATYACLRLRSMARSTGTKRANVWRGTVRALGPPGPGASSRFIAGSRLAIVDAKVVPHPNKFEGRIVGRIFERDPAAGTVDVLCGGALRIARVRRGTELAQPAAAVLTSVRESLGMNHSLELMNLRTRVDELEIARRPRKEIRSPSEPVTRGKQVGQGRYDDSSCRGWRRLLGPEFNSQFRYLPRHEARGGLRSRWRALDERSAGCGCAAGSRIRRAARPRRYRCGRHRHAGSLTPADGPGGSPRRQARVVGETLGGLGAGSQRSSCKRPGARPRVDGRPHVHLQPDGAEDQAIDRRRRNRRRVFHRQRRINLGLFQHDVNVVWDLAPHDLSILEFLIGQLPKSLSALATSHADNVREIEDIAYLNLDLGNGLLASFHVNWLTPVKVRHFIIGGSRKSIVYDDLQQAEKVKVYDRGITVNGDIEARRGVLVGYRTGDVWSPHIPQTEPLAKMVSHFAECIRDHKRPLTGGTSGLRTQCKSWKRPRPSIKAQGGRITL